MRESAVPNPTSDPPAKGREPTWFENPEYAIDRATERTNKLLAQLPRVPRAVPLPGADPAPQQPQADRKEADQG
jgi:hypothetical protein